MHRRDYTVPLFVCVTCLLSAGCERSMIVGEVVDVKGEALPGVAVGVWGGETRALTDGCGGYNLAFEPGVLALEFIKTGYTPGRLELTVHKARHVEATPVVLWPLPLSKGVYLFEDYRYRQTTVARPRPYRSETHVMICGAKKMPELETSNTQPLVLCYKMPRYDLELCRMEQADVTLPEAADPTYTVTVWISVGSLPVAPEPVDQPDASLVEVRIPNPLEPGVYAVHWGALDNYTTTDPHVFLFRVAGEAAETVVADGADKDAPAPEDG